MPSYFSNLFKIGASESVASPEKPMQPEPTLTHIRCNLQDQWVSAQDTLLYMLPNLAQHEIHARISKLPRAAYLRAFWPPSKDNEQLPDTAFKGVYFSNLQFLFEESEGTADTIKGMIVTFIDHIKETDADPTAHGMIVATDAKLSQAQKRFMRDVSARLLHPEVYYSQKKKRDTAFRQRKATKKQKLKPAPKPVLCHECEQPLDHHYLFCSKKIDTVSASDSNGQDQSS